MLQVQQQPVCWHESYHLRITTRLHLTMLLLQTLFILLQLGTYFIAFAARPAGANATVWPLYSYTWEGTYYSILSAQGNGSNTTTNTYWVNKKPTMNLSATGYVAVGMNTNASWYNNNTDPDYIAAYSAPGNQHITTPPGSAYWTGPWTSYAAAYPYFQIVGTTTKQW